MIEGLGHNFVCVYYFRHDDDAKKLMQHIFVARHGFFSFSLTLSLT